MPNDLEQIQYYISELIYYSFIFVLDTCTNVHLGLSIFGCGLLLVVGYFLVNTFYVFLVFPSFHQNCLF
jgi:hypothetical protein